MSISAISKGFSTACLTLGRVALPIAADMLTSLAFSRLSKTVSPQKKWVFSSITGLTTLYLTSNDHPTALSTVINSCLYGAFKVLTFIFIYKKKERSSTSVADSFPKEIKAPIAAAEPLKKGGSDLLTAVQSTSTKSAERKVHPSVEVLWKKHDQLKQRLTIVYEPTHYNVNREFWTALDAVSLQNQDEIRKRWQDPETIRLADELIQESARAMEDLYADLESAASKVPSEMRFSKMAMDLTSQQGPEFYYYRFCSQKTITLLDIYRTLRELSFFIYCPNVAEPRYQNNISGLTLQDRDVHPFFSKEDILQAKWRRIYNNLMDRFAPLMEEMRKFPGRESDLKRYWNWAVRDDALYPADRTDRTPNVFKLCPDGKPT